MLKKARLYNKVDPYVSTIMLWIALFFDLDGRRVSSTNSGLTSFYITEEIGFELYTPSYEYRRDILGKRIS